MRNHSKGKSPFEIVYSRSPRICINLTSIPSSLDLSNKAKTIVEHIQALHKEVRKHLEEASSQYKEHADNHRRDKEFKIGGLLMVHLRKSRLPSGMHNELTS